MGNQIGLTSAATPIILLTISIGIQLPQILKNRAKYLMEEETSRNYLPAIPMISARGGVYSSEIYLNQVMKIRKMIKTLYKTCKGREEIIRSNPSIQREALYTIEVLDLSKVSEQLHTFYRDIGMTYQLSFDENETKGLF